jgi:hypothetical protein
MTDNASLIAAARKRFSHIDSDVLKEMWSADGRREWAETALRLELLERGTHAQELDAVALRRADIAVSAPPSAKDTLWKYGVVGRGLTLAGVVLWVLVVHTLHGSGALAVSGALVVLGIYVYVLTRRTAAQRNHPLTAWASFVIHWQLGEAWLILIGTVIAAIFIFAG